ncbi:MAG: 23S rRNA (adenine(2030)-N(6))-methyltransferase RlmJ [Salaquimonas sp.]
MNYRHEFHAGNFADVFKHIVLVRIIEHLKEKEKAFRVLDTHAGSGLYALPSADELNHRGLPPEWVEGIGRLENWKPSAKVTELITPYLNVVLGKTNDEGQRLYPGSPLLAYEVMRKQDRLSACELNEAAFETLKDVFESNYQARILNLDGWLISGSQIPPKEKRGMMIIDPPFEIVGDFWRMAEAVTACSKRWHGGTVALWYPLKHQPEVQGFKNLLIEREISDLICIEMQIDRPTMPPKLFGCGMIIRNAPYKLVEEMKLILGELTPLLKAKNGQAKWAVTRLTDE